MALGRSKVKGGKELIQISINGGKEREFSLGEAEVIEILVAELEISSLKIKVGARMGFLWTHIRSVLVGCMSG